MKRLIAIVLLSCIGCEDDTPYGTVTYVPVPVPPQCSTPEPVQCPVAPECEECPSCPPVDDGDDEFVGLGPCGAHARTIRRWYNRYAGQCGWVQ
jgi:hypothetical protein